MGIVNAIVVLVLVAVLGIALMAFGAKVGQSSATTIVPAICNNCPAQQ